MPKNLRRFDISIDDKAKFWIVTIKEDSMFGYPPNISPSYFPAESRNTLEEITEVIKRELGHALTE